MEWKEETTGDEEGAEEVLLLPSTNWFKKESLEMKRTSLEALQHLMRRENKSELASDGQTDG